MVLPELVDPVRTGEAEVAKLQCSTEDRMNIHTNATPAPQRRQARARSVVEAGLRKGAAARDFNSTPETMVKSVEQFRR